jgi:hypothetical protein
MIEQLPQTLLGYPVIVTDYLPPVTVPRSWRERLLTRPWRPCQRTKTITNPNIYFVHGDDARYLLASARTLAALQQATKREPTP